MKLLILKSILFFLCLALSLGLIVDSIFVSRIDNFKDSIKEFNQLNNDTLDILYIGSSHSRNAFSTIITDSISSLRSYNISSGGQNIITSNFILEEFLKNNTVNLVVLEVTPLSVTLPERKETKGNQLSVFDNYSLNIEKVNAYQKIYDLKELPSAFSITLRNHDKWYNANWLFKKNQKFQHEEFISYYNGFIGVDKNLNASNVEKVKNFKEKYNNYLNVKPTLKDSIAFKINYEEITKTIEICSNNNIKVLFVSTPYFDSFYSKRNNMIHYSLTKFLNKKEADYIDYNALFEVLDFGINDFYDQTHVNIEGSRKVTNYLMWYLKQKNYFRNINSPFNKNPPSFEKQKNESLAQLKNNRIKNDIEIILDKKLNKLIIEDNIYENNKIDYLYYLKSNFRNYIVLEVKKEFNDTIFDSYNFGVHGKMSKEDFKLRPKHLLSTQKDLVTWSINPEILLIKEKTFIVLELEAKGSLYRYESIRLFLKNKEKYKGVIGKSIQIEKVDFSKNEFYDNRQ